MKESPSAENASRAELAAAVLAMCPVELGGIVIRARHDPTRDAWLQEYRRLLPTRQQWRRVPVNVSQEQLLGGLDFGATLNTGAPVYAKGLLAESDGGILELVMAERLDADRAALIATALDDARATSIVALDEGLDADEILDAALADRLALQLNGEDLQVADWSTQSWSRRQLAMARQRLPSVSIADEMVRSIAATSAALGINSLRGDLFAIRVARVLAALAAHESVSQGDAALAAQLVLAHRARVLPTEEATETSAEPEAAQSETEDNDSTGQRQDEIDDRVLDAAQAAIPAQLLAHAADFRRARGTRGSRGRAGKLQQGRKTGRVVGAAPADRARAGRLHLLATIRAALPWQTLRHAEQPGRAGTNRILFAPSDLKISRHKDRNESTTVFVVDASGSQAAQRLGEVKGAIELLIAECYVRRDQVALVAFRKRDAEILLAPTRALARAKRALAELPGGGGTPLAAGIDKAVLLVDVVRRQGRTPKVVFLTDGRANVCRDGTEGHEPATAEALHAAKLFRMTGLRPIVIDTSRRPRPAAREFAEAMAAAYVPLPQANAASINSVVAQAGAS